MKNKLLIAATAVLLASAWSTAAMAESRGTGCGLGYLVWKGQSGILPQTSAGTTNGLGYWPFNTQTVGMTIGTSGCDPNATVLNDTDTAKFAFVNYDQIKRDMARGEGEYLTTLATLKGIAANDRAAFYALTRERFAELAGPDTTVVEFLTKLEATLASTDSLARYAG